MVAENPSPDNDTMETLIETNEQLSKAMNLHQRAVLNARKVAGLGSPTPTPPINQGSNTTPVARTDSGFAAPPPGPPPGQRDQPRFSRKQPPIPPPGDYAPTDVDDENPFADPSDKKTNHQAPPPKETTPSSQFAGLEPYHPGFKETQSYIGRQDSAVGHVTMQSAVSPEPTDRTAGSDRRREERRQVDGEVEPEPKPASKPLYRY